MKIAVTGGNGFIGKHLARSLTLEGHDVVLVGRRKHAELNGNETLKFVVSDLSDPDVLRDAFSDCEAVAHCAGINREIGVQTYQKVHVEGTKNVVEAAKQAKVKRIALMSFLRARPNCG